MTRAKPLTVACPACGRKVEYDPRNPWRPFCSERCKTTDLGAWASNAYVIEGGPGEEEPSDADEADDRSRRPGN
jgi:hypothetical protein